MKIGMKVLKALDRVAYTDGESDCELKCVTKPFKREQLVEIIEKESGVKELTDALDDLLMTAKAYIPNHKNSGACIRALAALKKARSE